MTFGKRLRELREEKNLYQVDLAKHLNISSQALSLYELDKRSPDIPMIQSLCNFFDVSMDYLLCRVNIRNPYADMSDNDKITLRLLEKAKDLSDESKEELDELIDLLKYKDMMKKEKEDMERNKSLQVSRSIG